MFSKIKFSVKCSLNSSASERLTAKRPYYIAYKPFNTSAITYNKLIVIGLTKERAYGSCQTILFISFLQLLQKQIEILGRPLKTLIGFCMHSYLC